MSSAVVPTKPIVNGTPVAIEIDVAYRLLTLDPRVTPVVEFALVTVRAPSLVAPATPPTLFVRKEICVMLRAMFFG